MDMGITKGVKIRVINTAPLGDPIEITVRGYELSLRKEDAEKKEVEMMPAGTAPLPSVEEVRRIVSIIKSIIFTV